MADIALSSDITAGSLLLVQRLPEFLLGPLLFGGL